MISAKEFRLLSSNNPMHPVPRRENDSGHAETSEVTWRRV
jgi:hypothetical protein